MQKTNYSFIISIILLFSSFVATAQPKTFTPEQIKNDMAFLRGKLEKLHPGMYYYDTKENYSKLYDSLYVAVNKPMTSTEAFRYLAPLIIDIKDGHTGILYGTKHFPKTTKRLPFYIRKLENGYYISANMSHDSTILRGSEIVSLDDEPIDKIVNNIKPYISVDNNNTLSREYYATGNLPNSYLRYYGEKDSIKITYRLSDSTRYLTKKVACLTDAEIGKIGNKRYKALNRANLGLKIVDSLNHIAVLDITSFTLKGKFDPAQFKFKRALKQRFTSIQNNKIEHLIIDFRGNGGGFVPNIARLLRYLSKDKFTLMEEYGFKKTAYFTVAKPLLIAPPIMQWALFPKRKDGLMLQKNVNIGSGKPDKNLGYRGKSYFIIDPGCYSATTFTLALLKDLGIGEAYIGQQVGGATWGSFASSWKSIKLPNTKFTARIPLYIIKHKLKNQPENFFLQPTYEVGRNHQELIKNNSNSVDFTLDMIRKSLSAQKK